MPRLTSQCILDLLTAPVLQAVDGSEQDERVSRVIAQLGASQYADREDASKQLVAMGGIVVDPLIGAAQGNDSEVATRAVDALREMLRHDDSQLSSKAESALELIAEQGNLAVAQQAEVALDFFAAAQAVSARKKLEELGAIFSDAGPTGLRVEIAEDWKGDSSSLKLVTRLQKVVHVSFFGLQLTPRDAVTLGRLRGIERLDLFGVGLPEDAIKQLKQRLKETEIDFRKGGKLGIAGMPLQGQCVISGIQPGSSAEKAGLLPQDIITEINGTAINDFGACTRIIGQHKPGEEISVVIERMKPDGSVGQFRKVVVLGGW
ncbi:MAG: PDZ domain-containing protein [Planctomycetota bacterium]|nr:PDZ domain-containing protein [Planctomycetota bacterium]